MNKFVVSFLMIVLNASHFATAQESKLVKGIVWSGSINNPTYEALANQTSNVKVRSGNFARENEVQLRATSISDYVEVKHKKTNDWVQMRVPAQNHGLIDVNLLSIKAFQVSNCDQVKTIINLTSSTPKTEMHFNSKPIGSIKDDGRFYYESGAVCRDDKIDLLGTLPNCKDFTISFKAENNPHKYEGRANPDCSKKSASN